MQISRNLCRMHSLFWVSSVFLSILLWTRGAIADESPRRKKQVVLLTPGNGEQVGWSEAEEAFQEETVLLDISVKRISAEPAVDFTPSTMLPKTAAQYRADAAAAVMRTGDRRDRIEIWIYETEEGTLTTKSWALKNPADPDTAAIVGIRAAEALRAVLGAKEIRETPPPNALPQPSFPAIRSPGTRADGLRRIAVGAGVVVSASFKGSGVQSGFDLALAWRPLRFGGIALSAAYLPFGRNITEDGITSSLDMALFRARLVWHLIDKGRLRPALSVGGGGLLVFAQGETGDDRPLTKDLTKVGYVGGAASVSLAAVDWCQIQAEVGVGAALPGVDLNHGDALAARLGRPMLDAALRVAFGNF